MNEHIEKVESVVEEVVNEVNKHISLSQLLRNTQRAYSRNDVRYATIVGVAAGAAIGYFRRKVAW